ncbi:hydroxymethylbilane synthase [Alicyclobacillus acidocaldarius]|uniref:Porphobilinogen deaminase n=1 Tax=Alicyclobacillus acidocaldarius subsp. acidocaldarius (strain ATCC 27009 / DSM 446 / BCRC 14685 / JCM 5260 / KCTC 1825 / NBRC 15652 / NCIMB 11725 / NRRL B-14509 / 104-IA) TaxID=521098 RepID=C8WXM9_ALIAD|nr:hydroxymethylbilane synthase [Alicyclobacillus acidocaldarius]ACV58850.1 porphobilinogen deaminase [Alicyclobacillus acidocaldarius subsp. acidocaldarius DSM 446]
MRTLRVATRRSALALTQTNHVVDLLKQVAHGVEFELVPIRTRGDEIVDRALSEVGGKGLFVADIEDALATGQADLAVHSLKDVPFELRDGLTIGAVPPREDPRDALISRTGQGLFDLPPGARVGTSSLRRQAALRRLRPDLCVETLRGNVDTRLRRLEEGQFDAIVLAASGLHRLGLAERITEYLPVDRFVPAVGQGALAIECRAEDDEVMRHLAAIADPDATRAVEAERAFLSRLEGSCQVPIGAYAEPVGHELRLIAFVADPSGIHHLQLERTGDEARALGVAMAEEMLRQGAEDWLKPGRGG